MNERQLILRLTRKDFDVQVFRAGGKGGQNQNKTSSGVRIIHRASGAVGEARDQRSQLQNKRNAFLRMAESPRFKAWHRVAIGRAALETPPTPAPLQEEDLLVERKVNGSWERW